LDSALDTAQAPNPSWESPLRLDAPSKNFISASKAWTAFCAGLGAALLLTDLLTPTLPVPEAPLVLLIQLEAPASESGFGAISIYDLVAVAKVIVADS